MKIKLSKLIINNFKGIKKFELQTGGENATIIGENGTGKTSVGDAFYWLFTDSNLERKSKFGIIKIGADKAKVEGEIFIGSRPILAKKIYRPVIKKEIMTGYTTDHFIDGSKVSQKEYYKELGLPDDIRLISDVHYFMSIPVAQRRELIFNLIGKIKDDKIIKEYETLKPVRKILGGRELSNRRRMLTNDKKQLEEEKKEIPIEIRTLQSITPNIIGMDLSKIESEIDELDEQIAKIKHGADKIKKIAELEAEQIGLKASIKEQYKPKFDKLVESQLDLKKRIASGNEQIFQDEKKLNSKYESLAVKKDELENLRKRWREQRRLKYKPAKICYACGQAIPESQLAMQEKEFKRDQAETIKLIDKDGKELTQLVKGLEKEIPANKEMIDYLISSVKASENEVLKIQDDIEKLEIKLDDEINIKLKAIVDEIVDLKRLDQSSDLYQLQEKKSKLEANRLSIVQAKTNDKAVKTLEKKNNRISKEIERIEKDIWLLDEFNRKKAEFIESLINDRFYITDWKLFEILQNGNIRDICDPVYKGVPFIDLNTGSKINVGLDICNTFSDHIRIKFPIFVDNSESITSWIDTENQLINLMAIKGEKKLKVE